MNDNLDITIYPFKKRRDRRCVRTVSWEWRTKLISNIYICVCFYSLCIIVVEEIFVLLTLANIKQMPLIDRLYMKIIVQYILLEQQRLFIFYFKWKFWKKNFLYTRRKQLNKFWLFRLLMIGLIVASLFSLASNNINSSTCNKHFYFKIRGTIDIIRSLNI